MMSLATLGFGLTKANWMGKFFVYWLPVWTVVRNKQMSQTKSVAKHFERWITSNIPARFLSNYITAQTIYFTRQRVFTLYACVRACVFWCWSVAAMCITIQTITTLHYAFIQMIKRRNN